MSIHRKFFWAVLCLALAPCAKAQEPGSPRLSGVWTALEREGLPASELTFQPKDKLTISSGGITMEGRYEIDSSKSPNILVFYPDSFPGQKMNCSIKIRSATEMDVSTACDGTPAALARQDIIAFVHK